jgi:hypothetical protein
MKTKRDKPTKKTIPQIYIYGEGETEENYFTSVKQDFNNVNVKPELPKKSGYKKSFSDIEILLKELKSDLPVKIYCLIDMDAIIHDNKKVDYNAQKEKLLKHKNAKGLLEIIESHPCIEFWFLLHFEKISRYFNHCDDVETFLKNHPILSNYCKESRYTKDIYTKLKALLCDAIKNGKWNSSLNVEIKSYSEIWKIFEYLNNLNQYADSK